MVGNDVKKIVFLTGTRADFGKIKPLFLGLQESKKFEAHIFVTGMHLDKKYGETFHEIEKSGLKNIHTFVNHSHGYDQDALLSETIYGFRNFIKTLQPDMIVVHGDRVEALSGALVGALNNIFVAHIEGGEISGSIDEHIRHSISKLSNLHFVSNQEAKQRLRQMGEQEETIFVIGSPDIDVMISSDLPDLFEVKRRYDISFDDFALLIFHPVTTELNNLSFIANQLVDAVLESEFNYIVIHPNNDPGTDIILDLFQQKLSNHSRFALFPSLRFEHFLTLLKESHFIIGNSSAGIREAPYYGVPAINVGNRQSGRMKNNFTESIKHCDFGKDSILSFIQEHTDSRVRYKPTHHFGVGNSRKNFLEVLNQDNLWKTKTQKQFLDIDF